MNFLVLQHAEWEGLGLLEKSIGKINASIELLELFRNEKISFEKVHKKHYNAIIGLGSPSTVYRPETNPTHFEEVELHRIIRKLKIPSFNICYSMQLFSIANGGEVHPNPDSKEVGFHDVYLTEEGKKDPVFKDIGNFKTLQWHGDIVHKLPSNSKHLGYSKKTRNQIAVVDGIHYLVQFDGQAAFPEMLSVWLEADKKWACEGTSLDIQQVKEEAHKNRQYYENIITQIFLNFANRIVSTSNP